MSNDPFARSSGGSQLRGYAGQTALITPLEFAPGAITSPRGPVDGVRANVVFFDMESPNPVENATVVDGMLILNGPVVSELNLILAQKGKPGAKTMQLGKVKEKPNTKGGDKPIVVLDGPDDKDVEVARAYLASIKPEDPFA